MSITERAVEHDSMRSLLNADLHKSQQEVQRDPGAVGSARDTGPEGHGRQRRRNAHAARLALTSFTRVVLGTATLIVFFISTFTSNVFASNCKSLLLFVEGGGWTEAKFTSGWRLREIAEIYSEEYPQVAVISASHEAYMLDLFYFDFEAIEDAADSISQSTVAPIVIVGHSLGAATAYEIADALPTWRQNQYLLLITLDGVSWDPNNFWNLRIGERRWLPLGSGKKWIDVNAIGNWGIFGCHNGAGPDWDGQANADRKINVNACHKEVDKMLIKVKSDINDWLTNCDHLYNWYDQLGTNNNHIPTIPGGRRF